MSTIPSDDRDPVLDEVALGRLRELDPSGKNRVIERVFAAFESSSSKLMAQLAAARPGGNLTDVRYVAHTLKAASASIGALRLSEVCKQIEQMVDQSKTEHLSERIDEMTVEMNRVLEHLRSLKASSS